MQCQGVYNGMCTVVLYKSAVGRTFPHCASEDGGAYCGPGYSPPLRHVGSFPHRPALPRTVLPPICSFQSIFQTLRALIFTAALLPGDSSACICGLTATRNIIPPGLDIFVSSNTQPVLILDSHNIDLCVRFLAHCLSHVVTAHLSFGNYSVIFSS